MPLILRLALVFCAATVTGLFSGAMALYAAIAVAIVSVRNLSYLCVFASLGLALGALAGEARNKACWRFEDNQKLQFTGVLESLPVNEKIVLRMLTPCRTIVSARLPKGKSIPSGKEFLARGQWQSLVVTTEAVARPGGGILVIHAIDSVTDNTHHLLLWRSKVQGSIRHLFPRHAGLAESLLVAQRDALDPELRARYAAAGLTHLLAISGTHVALVAAVLWMFARMARLPRRASHIACVAGTAAYVVFLGAPFAAIRALLQLLLMIVAHNLQRPSHPLGLIAAAALAIVAMHPHAVVDAGFQLSFAGITAIVLWRRPLIDRMPASVPTVLRDAVATTVAATIVTTPIAAFHFGQVSTIALVANLLAIPAVTVAVPASAAAAAVSIVSMPAGQFVASGAEIPLASLDRVATASAATPYGHFAAHPRQLWTLLFDARGARHLEIHMIDVGQGDAVALRTPGGKWLLVDAGPASPTYDAGEKRVVPFLLERGVRTIDGFIITHPDLDHFGGARAVVRTFDVKRVYDPGIPVPKSAYDSLLITAAQRGTAWQTVRAGNSITFDRVTIDFLHPDTLLLDASEAANDYSAVFRLTYGAFTALFLGDVSTEVEDRLVKRYGRGVDVDLLKVGHHGSSTSTGVELLAQSTPQVALIGVGRRNRYRHPNPGVISRLEAAGATILRTDEQGSISLRITARGEMTARTGQ